MCCCPPPAPTAASTSAEPPAAAAAAAIGDAASKSAKQLASRMCAVGSSDGDLSVWCGWNAAALGRSGVRSAAPKAPIHPRQTREPEPGETHTRVGQEGRAVGQEAQGARGALVRGLRKTGLRMGGRMCRRMGAGQRAEVVRARGLSRGIMIDRAMGRWCARNGWWDSTAIVHDHPRNRIDSIESNPGTDSQLLETTWTHRIAGLVARAIRGMPLPRSG